jgi:CRP-like cAMP-binding protein
MLRNLLRKQVSFLRSPLSCLPVSFCLSHVLQIINSSPILSVLESDQKAMIIRALEGPVMKAAGETIIQQGDSGDCFYLLQDGTVEVFVRRGRNGEESLTHTYGAGSTFGELSLLYNAPRAATCRANTDCVLWTLDRLSFRVSRLIPLSSLLSPPTGSRCLFDSQKAREVHVLPQTGPHLGDSLRDGAPCCRRHIGSTRAFKRRDHLRGREAW